MKTFGRKQQSIIRQVFLNPHHTYAVDLWQTCKDENCDTLLRMGFSVLSRADSLSLTIYIFLEKMQVRVSNRLLVPAHRTPQHHTHLGKKMRVWSNNLCELYGVLTHSPPIFPAYRRIAALWGKTSPSTVRIGSWAKGRSGAQHDDAKGPWARGRGVYLHVETWTSPRERFRGSIRA